MQIAHFNTTLSGGAAIAARRLHESLEEYSVASVFCFRQGSPPGPTYRSFYGTGGFAPSQVKKLFFRKASSLLSLLASRKSVKGYDLFTYPGLFHGMKNLESFSSIPEILHLHWIAYFIDFPSFFRSLPESMPIVWTLHDMNPFTGGCHYSWGCDRFQTKCHNCPQLLRPSSKDLSKRGFDIKLESLKYENLHVVADSYWLENQARSSTIFKHARSIQTIHYGLDVDVFSPEDKIRSKKALGIDPDQVVVAFGADSISWRRKGRSELQGALGLLQGDFDRDCYVDLNDLKLLTLKWLDDVDPNDRYNLYGHEETEPYGIIDFLDFAVYADSWDGNIPDLKMFVDIWLDEVDVNNIYNLFHGNDVGPMGVVNFFDFAIFADDWLKTSYEQNE